MLRRQRYIGNGIPSFPLLPAVFKPINTFEKYRSFVLFYVLIIAHVFYFRKLFPEKSKIVSIK